jgi:membrane-associated phospholipid phosphatase
MGQKTKKGQEKKQFLKLSQGAQLRLARLISEVANPIFVAPPIFLAIAVRTAPDIQHALLWWVITVVGISAAPLLFILRGVRLGHLSDHHVSIREQRLVPLLFALGCVIGVFIILFLLHASYSLLATMIAVLITGIIGTVITRYWKISFHLVGIAGAVTVLWILFGSVAAFLSPTVLLVAWARWRVGAHTPLQALAGTVLAVSVALGTYWLLGIR